MIRFYAMGWFFFFVASIIYINLVDRVSAGNTVLGNDFLVGLVPHVSPERCNVTIVITTNQSTNATISTAIMDPIVVREFSKVATVVLPGTLIPQFVREAYPVTYGHGFRVNTQDESSVRVIINSTIIEDFDSEGFLVCPIDASRDEYLYSITVNGTKGFGTYSAFVIVASDRAWVNFATTSVTLDEPLSMAIVLDTTGVSVGSRAPITVFQGGTFYYGPKDPMNGYYMEQVLPRDELS